MKFNGLTLKSGFWNTSKYAIMQHICGIYILVLGKIRKNSQSGNKTVFPVSDSDHRLVTKGRYVLDFGYTVEQPQKRSFRRCYTQPSSYRRCPWSPQISKTNETCGVCNISQTEHACRGHCQQHKEEKLTVPTKNPSILSSKIPQFY